MKQITHDIFWRIILYFCGFLKFFFLYLKTLFFKKNFSCNVDVFYLFWKPSWFSFKKYLRWYKIHFSWPLIKINRTFGRIKFKCLQTHYKCFWQNILFFYENLWRKKINNFYILSTKFCWFCQVRWLLAKKHFDISVTGKFFFKKIPKQSFYTWKKLQKATQI